MIIEIRGVGYINKGAELMLHAILQEVTARYPNATLVMAPSHARAPQPFEKFAPMGFFPKAWIWRYGVQLGDFAGILPKKLREMYGVILDKQVDVVLDASGFGYSDQWGVGHCKELARATKRWKRRGTQVILLPQAFGPFRSKGIRKHVERWVENTDLIFARERDSYGHLIDVVGEKEKIKLYADFTNLVRGTMPEGYDATDKRVALVPNYRMIDKTSEEASKAYLPFMIACAKYLVEKEAKPFVLVHEGVKDQMLADQISSAVGGIPIVKETNPLHIKGILSSCDATIGSRFHGLVSALSQGVPSLAAGWSHKYVRLFEDYGFNEGLVSVTDSEVDLHEKINLLLEPTLVSPIKQQLKETSEALKRSSEEMWALVFKEMDAKAAHLRELKGANCS